MKIILVSFLLLVAQMVVGANTNKGIVAQMVVGENTNKGINYSWLFI